MRYIIKKDIKLPMSNLIEGRYLVIILFLMFCVWNSLAWLNQLCNWTQLFAEIFKVWQLNAIGSRYARFCDNWRGLKNGDCMPIIRLNVTVTLCCQFWGKNHCKLGLDLGFGDCHDVAGTKNHVNLKDRKVMYCAPLKRNSRAFIYTKC